MAELGGPGFEAGAATSRAWDLAKGLDHFELSRPSVPRGLRSEVGAHTVVGALDTGSACRAPDVGLP